MINSRTGWDYGDGYCYQAAFIPPGLETTTTTTTTTSVNLTAGRERPVYTGVRRASPRLSKILLAPGYGTSPATHKPGHSMPHLSWTSLTIENPHLDF